MCVYAAYDSRHADDVDTVPLEVVTPLVVPWMEESRYFVRFGIDARQVRAFMEIAVDTRESEVVGVVRTAMLPGDDVLDVERGKRRIILM